MPERCIDASVAIKWVVQGERWRQKARQFLFDSLARGYTLIAPPLFVYETESVMQQFLTSGTLSLAEADAAITRLEAIGIQVVTHPDMIRRAREIARLFGQAQIYDSLYAALAELRGCEFWTADKRYYDDVAAALPHVKFLLNYR